MPVVFVHGVGNHDKDKFDTATGFRNALFKRFPLVAAGSDLIYSPYWGAAGASARWDKASRPGEKLENLGVGDEDEGLFWSLVEAAAPPGGDPTDVLVDTARKSLADAVDLLYSAIDLESCDDDAVDELAELALKLVEYGENHARIDMDDPLWEDLGDDMDLVARLVAGDSHAESQLEETLGIGSVIGAVGVRLREAAQRLRTKVVGAPTALAASGLREFTGDHVTSFLGDVLKYLALRETPAAPGDIVKIVIRDLEEARRAAPGEPLVVVAHSMGGNIVYDIASFFRPDLTIDTLVTVGSQVGLFAELSVFKAVAGDLPTADVRKIPAVAAIKSWINVVDPADILAYRAEPIFETAHDFNYPTGALWAHSAYFKQPNFFARLAKKVAEPK